MKLINNIQSITQPFKNAVITIGNFDGVHIGHQALFHSVIEKAESINGTSVAMTFDPHPLVVLKHTNKPKLITTTQQKIKLIADTGINVVITQPFTSEFAKLTPQQFVSDILVNKIGMKAVIVGKDYSFGKNREGNIEFLKSTAKKLNFEVIVADWIKTRAGIYGRISSTRIRELVINGDVATAQKLLGRFYQIQGVVEKGRDRGGKVLGFPTANIKLDQETLCPETGVYAVSVNHNNQKYIGIANIGYSPTFEDGIFTVEVHILDFNKNIYGQKISLSFAERIRGEIKFSNVTELSVQIKKDIKKLKLNKYGI